MASSILSMVASNFIIAAFWAYTFFKSLSSSFSFSAALIASLFAFSACCFSILSCSDAQFCHTRFLASKLASSFLISKSLLGVLLIETEPCIFCILDNAVSYPNIESLATFNCSVSFFTYSVKGSLPPIFLPLLYIPLSSFSNAMAFCQAISNLSLIEFIILPSLLSIFILLT